MVAQRKRPRRQFAPKPAHNRAILIESGRATTPEQLEHMNEDDQPRFREVISSSESATSSDDKEDETTQKRVKMVHESPLSVPKWSNPDPYTVLPPPGTQTAAKKDIVQLIRKAKMEAASKEQGNNAVTTNQDFISFDTGEKVQEVIDVPEENLSECEAPIVLDDMESSDEEDLPSPKVKVTSTKHEKRPSIKCPLTEEWTPKGGNPTPWYTGETADVTDPGARLHMEICDFYEYVRPHHYEETAREGLIRRVRDAIRHSSVEGSHNAEVKSFGSFAAGLYLPTADMDLVALSAEYRHAGCRMLCQSSTSMRKVANQLKMQRVALSGVTVIAKAKVPILKFKDSVTGIRVDVSFENSSGIHANETFLEWKRLYPTMPILVVLIKQMLAMRGLNEVFTGGVGGFTVTCLVVSLLQLMPAVQSGNMDPRMHLSDVLLEFLELYGVKFDIRCVGIRFDPPGYYNKLESPDHPPGQNPGRLSIIDPNNRFNDISGGSRRINDVLNCFREAVMTLRDRLHKIAVGEADRGSILGCIFGGDYSSYQAQRDRSYRLHQGNYVTPHTAPPSIIGKRRYIGPPRQGR
ncbi:Nucleotidyltransferase [Piedraia hortae CBS 480.64]|uniref:polynucleotide adenylyltransferase n=1 Tax=Piedraia hortae CBS 480.64 TaxID=1314780 RepID=A0A6A7BQR9_9PEZI|nr:Nucleotidyltransferase [Piedraia hortae CBS 480.64]